MDTVTIIIVVLVVLNLVLTLWVLSYWRRRGLIDSGDAIEARLESLKAEVISKQMEGLIALRESLDSANRLLNERLAEGTQ
ncbi:MAG: hypothetical protein JSV52_06270, partial [Candidatus Zixiibacteriota bacterium]